MPKNIEEAVRILFLSVIEADLYCEHFVIILSSSAAPSLLPLSLDSIHNRAVVFLNPKMWGCRWNVVSIWSQNVSYHAVYFFEWKYTCRRVSDSHFGSPRGLKLRTCAILFPHHIYYKKVGNWPTPRTLRRRPG